MNERELTLEILLTITRGKGYNNIALKNALDAHPELKRESRAFVTECVNGTLRRLLTLDYIINKTSKTHTRRMSPRTLTVLRMSLYQLIYMDKVPAHAVCDEAVKLTQGPVWLKGFVNAVLRAAAANLPALLSGIDNIEPCKTRLGVKYSMPEEVVDILFYYLGEAETLSLLEYVNTTKPLVTVRVNTLKTDAKTLARTFAAERVKALPGLYFQNTLRLTDAPGLTTLPSHRDGLYHVMDEGAMLAVSLANPKPGQKILDVCAAPGGKAFMAAYETGDTGEIYARDIHPHKIGLLTGGTKRLGLKSINVKEWDATVKDHDDLSAYDIVMLDVPCSGLGLLSKKPDVRYNFSMRSVSALQGLQRRILNVCCDYVKPGGTLLYSTCTLTPEENEKNRDWLLKSFDFQSADISPLLPPGLTQTGPGYIRLLPHITGTDGFFIAKFIRGGAHG